MSSKSNLEVNIVSDVHPWACCRDQRAGKDMYSYARRRVYQNVGAGRE